MVEERVKWSAAQDLLDLDGAERYHGEGECKYQHRSCKDDIEDAFGDDYFAWLGAHRSGVETYYYNCDTTLVNLCSGNFVVC